MTDPNAPWPFNENDPFLLPDPDRVAAPEPELPVAGKLRLCLEGDAQEVLALLRTLLPPVDDSALALRSLPGRRMGQANLTPAVVRDIRARVARGEPKAAVARLYGICPESVRNIVKRKSWAEVPD